VDDGSPAPAESTVARFRGRLALTVVRQVRQGPAKARNAGAARARGDYLAFTDDDCTVSPGWLRSLARRLEAAPRCAVGGRTLNALSGNLFSTASQLLVDYLYTRFNTDPERPFFMASNNLAFPVACFRDVGGFDPAYVRAAGEDRDLCRRWLDSGRRLVHASDAVVHHAHALTLRGFWRQHFNYGRGAYLFHHKRAQGSGSRIRLEPLSFYLGLLGFPFSRKDGCHPALLSALLFLAQQATAAGFILECFGGQRAPEG